MFLKQVKSNDSNIHVASLFGLYTVVCTVYSCTIDIEI